MKAIDKSFNELNREWAEPIEAVLLKYEPEDLTASYRLEFGPTGGFFDS